MGFVGPTLVSTRFTPTAQPEQPGRKFVFTTSLNLPGTVKLLALGFFMLENRFPSLQQPKKAKKTTRRHAQRGKVMIQISFIVNSELQGYLGETVLTLLVTFMEYTEISIAHLEMHLKSSKRVEVQFSIFLGLKQLPRVSVLRVVI